MDTKQYIVCFIRGTKQYFGYPFIVINFNNSL